MISAAEALRLPSAQLTDDELAAAERLESAIDEHIRMHMNFRGCELNGNETNNNVLAEINRRLKQAGYSAQWQLLTEQHQLNKAIQKPVGFRLSFAPTDESYTEAARLALS